MPAWKASPGFLHCLVVIKPDIAGPYTRRPGI
jgi:hypothetical protein